MDSKIQAALVVGFHHIRSFFSVYPVYSNKGSMAFFVAPYTFLWILMAPYRSLSFLIVSAYLWFLRVFRVA